jgi:hypothetical protein
VVVDLQLVAAFNAGILGGSRPSEGTNPKEEA